MAAGLFCFSEDRLCYERVTGGLGIQKMAGRHRCQQKQAPGNIEDYSESKPTFPELLPSLIWPRACAAVTADSHDVGVFLAH